MSVWIGGRAAGDGDVPLAADRGFLLGDGLFETVLVVGGIARHLDRHLARLDASSAAFGIPPPAGLAAAIAAALPALVDREGRPERAALRITLTRGAGRGLTPLPGPPGLVISLTTLRDAPGAAVAVRVVSAPRIDPLDPLAGHKTLSRMGRVEARRAALAAGDDAALLTTIDGDVCDADAANVFAVIDGVVVTPPLDRGILPGITRARCLEALAASGRAARELRLLPSELARASEVFLTSSLSGVQPVSRLDGTTLAGSNPVADGLAAWLGTS